jgi:hypothetical protein
MDNQTQYDHQTNDKGYIPFGNFPKIDVRYGTADIESRPNRRSLLTDPPAHDEHHREL